MKHVLLILLAAATLLTQGCATITRGTSQGYVIESEPAGAQVTLSNGQTCTTPCALNLKRKHGFTATFKKDGFQTQQTNVVSQIADMGAAGMAGNVVFGGVIGVGVDALSGATNELVPNPLKITLTPEKGRREDDLAQGVRPASSGTSG